MEEEGVENKTVKSGMVTPELEMLTIATMVL